MFGAVLGFRGREVGSENTESYFYNQTADFIYDG